MKQEKQIIDGVEYRVTQMDAVSALKVQTKIIKLLGPGALALLDQKGPIQDRLQKLIPMLMQNFDDKNANELILLLFEKGVFYQDGDATKVIDFEEYFTGKPMLMWKMVKFILEVNFNLGEFIKWNSLITEEDQDQKES